MSPVLTQSNPTHPTPEPRQPSSSLPKHRDRTPPVSAAPTHPPRPPGRGPRAHVAASRPRLQYPARRRRLPVSPPGLRSRLSSDPASLLLLVFLRLRPGPGTRFPRQQRSHQIKSELQRERERERNPSSPFPSKRFPVESLCPAWF
jgi:hypothetical protein